MIYHRFAVPDQENFSPVRHARHTGSLSGLRNNRMNSINGFFDFCQQKLQRDSIDSIYAFNKHILNDSLKLPSVISHWISLHAVDHTRKLRNYCTSFVLFIYLIVYKFFFIRLRKELFRISSVIINTIYEVRSWENVRPLRDCA